MMIQSLCRTEGGEGSVAVRSIWQGKLLIAKHEVPVKLYSAVLDRQVHFHLLHEADRTRVQQRLVDAETEKVVPFEQTRRAFEAEPGVYVPVSSEELERTVPVPSREIKVGRFVRESAIEPHLFDRPYYLGPAENSSADYFALAEAIGTRSCAGIAAWVMRKHSYVGALVAQHGYLMVITLRHTEEVVRSNQLDAPEAGPLDPKEKTLAEKLVEALSGRFQPETFHDEYQARIRELIEAKKAGKKVKPKPVRARRRTGSLADSLQASLKGIAAARPA
jgi:DNA end-binding protein Ku